MSITITDHQLSGVAPAVDWFREAYSNRSKFECFRHGGESYLNRGQSFSLCGFAGTGKSTCVPALIDKMGLQPEEVMFMAPTGKAAKVMSNKLSAAGVNARATTIHSMIYIPRKERADKLQDKITKLQIHLNWRKSENFSDSYASNLPWDSPGYCKSVVDIADEIDDIETELEKALESALNNGPSFILKSYHELRNSAKLFCVDEASMVGTQLANDMATFGLPILAIGDPGQLPPPTDTWGFNLTNPDVFLTEIHRQARDNPIIELATKARQGEWLKECDYGNGVRVVKRRNDDYTLDMSNNAMVLVGTNATRWNLTKRIRDALGIKSTGPMKDEPLLVCRNSRDNPNLVNGSMMVNNKDFGNLVPGESRIKLSMTDEDSGIEYELECAQPLFEEHYYRRKNSFSSNSKDAFSAKVQCEHVDWGHVLTVHKAQGSEWDSVILHDESGTFRSEGQRWLYTGITRASEELTVVIT